MTVPVIEVDGLGKLYRISHEQRGGYTTLGEAVSGMARKPLQRLREGRPEREDFWALRDISFDVAEGEVVGIVGRNGAGKSTLLKILSRIVEPSAGRAQMRGRPASLLEVGTGFHGELTGRENVFLNGAILGMSRREIASKFDEIVAFSEVEKFLDTPVKRYSSGMYVRLAFAVAAHLEPDILIVDEVLAVGDLEFQKKSLGKMRSVAREGRTVLFVSHNTGAVLDLCDRGLLLENGQVKKAGSIEEVVGEYVRAGVESVGGVFRRKPFDRSAEVVSAITLSGADGAARDVFTYGEALTLTLETAGTAADEFGIELRIKNSTHQPVVYVSSWIAGDRRFRTGDRIRITVPRLPLVEDTYYVDVICRIPKVRHVDNWWDNVRFTVVSSKPGASPITLQQSDQLGSLVVEDAVFETC